tara:strand:+ start:3504 stop:5195 length:1692 start_codon:yes stop_codon:yes gene_type:complete
MFYIGISAYYHESSVFLTDGMLVNCFIKEEYFTRIKGDKSFPKRSLEFLINKYSLNEQNINSICFYEKPFKSWWEIFIYSIKKPLLNKRFLTHHLKNFNTGSIFFYTHLNNVIKISKNKILYSSHHLSHCLYGSLYAENIDNYAYVSCDGVGEGETMTVYTINSKNLIKKHWTNFYPNSIGLFYSAITDFLGFDINDGEFKVMSLSSYGNPVYEKEMDKIFDCEKLKINSSYFEFQKNPERSFSNLLIKIFGEPYLNLDIKENFQKYSDIASSAQLLLNKSVKNLILKAKKLTGKNKIVLTGGVALNCKMIHDLSKQNIFDELIVPPSPGDSGSAIGAANFSYLYKNKKFLNNISLFPGPNKEDINKKFKLNEFFEKISNQENSLEIASDLICKGNILTTYIDRTETGPRALGNTSILCNAKNKLTVQNLNNKIKKREFYQPLAPILLRENFEKYFVIQNSIKKNLYSMGTLCEAKKDLKNEYDSIIHIDNTCRTQIIDNKNSYIFKLLKKLSENNINILVNTSFNISKDPMVFDLFDVYTNMRRMNIEYVVMNHGIFKVKEI